MDRISMVGMKTFLLVVVSAGIAAAQPIGAGLKVGGTLTDTINYALLHTSTKSAIVGAYLEVRLPAKFAVEGDVLYQTDLGLISPFTSSGSQWVFPIVAKYRFTSGIVRPYVEGGLAFSHLSDVANIASLNHETNFGIVLGGGIEFKLLFLRISPEFRYYGYTLKNIESVTGQFESNRNQAVFQVGIGF